MRGGPNAVSGLAIIAAAELAARLTTRGRGSQLKLGLVGDSMAGFQANGHGYAILERLQGLRGDITCVGSVSVSPAFPYHLGGVLKHDGHAGETIDNMLASTAARIAAAGPADVYVVDAGTNNDPTDSGAVSAAKAGQLIDLIQAAAPGSYVVWIATKPSPTASPNDVARAARHALMTAVCAARQRCIYVDPQTTARADGLASDTPAFTHYNDGGKAKVADAVMAALAQILPPATLPGLPLPCTGGNVQSSLNLTAASTHIYAQNVATIEPGSGSFAICLQVFFPSLPVSTGSLYTYGFGGNAYALAFAVGAAGGVNVYVNKSSTAITWDGGAQTLPKVFPSAATWYSLIIHYELATQTLSIWRDGMLIAVKTGIALTLPVGDYTLIGDNSGVLSGASSAPVVRRFAVVKGSANVPPFASMAPYAAAWRTAQRLPVLAGGAASCLYLCADTFTVPPLSLVDQLGGTTITQYGGTPTQSAAGVYVTPWDNVR